MFCFGAVFVSLCAMASARMAYQLPDGAEDILSARSFTETFSCDQLQYGYYADIDNNCEIFHICFPVMDDQGAVIETAHFSMMCGNETIFSQDSLSCAHRDSAFPCEESAGLYDLSNSGFGTVSVDVPRARAEVRANIQEAPAPAPAPEAEEPNAPETVEDTPVEAPEEPQP